MLQRPFFENEIKNVLELHSACALLGPRQCGKTTLAHNFAAIHAETFNQEIHFFDLENIQHVNALSSPALTLEPLKGLIVLDEIQRRPDLFPYLRYLCDYSDKKFLILGSASRDLIHQSSETLAGRISYIELTPFTLNEVDNIQSHWLRGGFPKSYLASSESQSERWRKDFISTFLERDLAALGFSSNPVLMNKLWIMVAHYHGQTANFSDIGRSLDLSDKSIKRYLEILCGSFMVRLLKPWHENLSKRQVKSPKIYIRDSGLFHTLLNLTPDNWYLNPKIGASWEGYALEEALRFLNVTEQESYFWATEKGAELDLLVLKNGQKLGFEFKYSDAPKVTRSMRIAIEDLELETLTIITPGNNSYQLTEKIFVKGLLPFIHNS